MTIYRRDHPPSPHAITTCPCCDQAEQRFDIGAFGVPMSRSRADWRALCTPCAEKAHRLQACPHEWARKSA